MKPRLFATALALTFAGAVQAQTPSNDSAKNYPSRPVRQIVPAPPGGGLDIASRVVATAWGEILGQPIVVDNRPGGGTTLGAGIAAAALPDGYSLFTCSIASHGIAPALYSGLPYDHIRSFAPISVIGNTPNVLVVSPSVPVRSLGEFVAYVKASPGKYNYSSPGVGVSTHMSMELFKLTTGIDLAHVPYKGGAPALAAVMGGEVIGAFGNQPELLGAIKGGKVRPLAVSTLKRSPELPDVPTVAESGFPGFNVTVWIGVCTQAAVPKPIIAKLNATLVRALSLPDVQTRLTANSIETSPTTPEQFAAFIQDETKKWARVAKDSNIPKQ